VGAGKKRFGNFSAAALRKARRGRGGIEPPGSRSLVHQIDEKGRRKKEIRDFMEGAIRPLILVNKEWRTVVLRGHYVPHLERTKKTPGGGLREMA